MKVLSYGSLNIDNVYTVDHFVRSGETMSSLKMEVFSGGKGLNQSRYGMPGQSEKKMGISF